MAASVDPFYVVKDELTAKIETINGKTAKFLELLDNTNTAKSVEFKDARRSLGKDLKSAEKQLRDLTFTVTTVQKDRAQFAHIDDYELEQRDAYIKKIRKNLNEMKATYQGERVKRKMIADERAMIESKPMSSLGATNSDEAENTQFIHDQQAQGQMIIRQQDEELEELGYAVDRVNDMAVGINEELKTQNQMLKTLEEDIDEAAEKMNFVMGKMAKLLKTKDTCQIWTVIILTLVLVLLVFLVIYT
mmetsp:Transcript_14830/g.26285  ORF Transcript_14830/g.26285 Transcript_14830/m.26285 type:complete len:247 (+) Transcript_14830:418-1158(+)|eukprot:CAMPEP_0205927642 /NCGR_PEP_ID=MMETSP1325-20131115/23026_1 /ASSEMBLY_ACC=CAM_ASM_000708 /TAXON_ID=236786 /ORGANISM="Florenciella sp., Strain RCC1007" /LENGTH=246 /DNA_ID=CAMNT_0053296551 /DNA_START=405 /DNA_END=1145 /DNA_ORIENTATION=+